MEMKVSFYVWNFKKNSTEFICKAQQNLCKNYWGEIIVVFSYRNLVGNNKRILVEQERGHDYSTYILNITKQ